MSPYLGLFFPPLLIFTLPYFSPPTRINLSHLHFHLISQWFSLLLSHILSTFSYSSYFSLTPTYIFAPSKSLILSTFLNTWIDLHNSLTYTFPLSFLSLIILPFLGISLSLCIITLVTFSLSLSLHPSLSPSLSQSPSFSLSQSPSLSLSVLSYFPFLPQSCLLHVPFRTLI